MIRFESVRIGDLGKIVTGKTPKTEKIENFGNDHMFIGPTDLHKHFFIKKSEKMISDTGLASIKNSSLNGLSILVGCIGWGMGNVGIVEGRCATNQQINSITDINKKYNPFYIYYWLKTKRDYLFKLASVTRTPILNKTDFSDIRVQLPREKLIQDKVADLLLAIDKKIELNNRINAELEAMAKTLYDYWFVQFDFPDRNGKPYKSSGGEMEFNALLKRQIPKNWSDDSLWNVADFYNGLPMQKFRPVDDNFLRVIKIKEMNEGFSENSEMARIDIPPQAVVDNGDILFSWSATLDVKIWSRGIGALNQHIFKVTSSKYSKNFIYFELLNYLTHFKMMADQRKTTMGHITQDHLKQSRIVLPPSDLIKRMDEYMKPIFEKHLALEQENQQLTELRDWLLPMLMNGQVTVK
ncbi:restriction endonuclease subunit S [Undibacterium sp.]|uniref:restriction endonuclease subunit S n=1 Tax=Undibacterium sp. TaxID=1914977 RepID=UPI0037528BE7